MPARPIDDHVGRSALWRSVWHDRDDERADWNGFVQCFESIEHYERWTRHIASSLCSDIDLTDGDTVADLGCGTGRFAALVAPHVQGVLTFDYGAAPIRVAVAKRQLPNISYQVADVTALQPRTLAVSKAYAVSSLYYLDSAEVVFDLIRRRPVGSAGSGSSHEDGIGEQFRHN